MRIVCIGDSVTAGQYLHGPHDHRNPPPGVWPTLIEGHEVIARGLSNETSRQILERFPRDVQDLAPDKVVIQCGHNDCNRWPSDRGLPRVSREAFRANLWEMIDRCRALDAEPILCTITPTLKGEGYEMDAQEYSAIVRGVAMGAAVTVAHTRRAFLATGFARLLLDDGIHLNADGHKLYAEVVQACL